MTRKYLSDLLTLIVMSVIAEVCAAQMLGGPYALHPIDINEGGTSCSAGPYVAVVSTSQHGGPGTIDAGPYRFDDGFLSRVRDGLYGIPCLSDADCARADGNACSFDTCPGGLCFSDPVEYGNVNGSTSGAADLDDILCTLAGFGNFGLCPNADIAPTTGPGACQGDDIINLDDILAILAAFGGADPCQCMP